MLGSQWPKSLRDLGDNFVRAGCWERENLGLLAVFRFSLFCKNLSKNVSVTLLCQVLLGKIKSKNKIYNIKKKLKIYTSKESKPKRDGHERDTPTRAGCLPGENIRI